MMLSQSESSIQTDHGIMQNKVKVNQALFLMTDWLYVILFTFYCLTLFYYFTWWLA